MAGDIEEFLRRAAQRRQQRDNQQRSRQTPERPQRRPAPEYSDSRAERVARARQVVQQAPVMAEIIEDEELPVRTLAARRKERETLNDQDRSRAANKSKEQGSPSTSDGNLQQQLIAMLRSPSGLRQAFVVREILEPRFKTW